MSSSIAVEKVEDTSLDWIEISFTKNSYSRPPELLKLIVDETHEVIVAGAVIAPPFA